MGFSMLSTTHIPGQGVVIQDRKFRRAGTQTHLPRRVFIQETQGHMPRRHRACKPHCVKQNSDFKNFRSGSLSGHLWGQWKSPSTAWLSGRWPHPGLGPAKARRQEHHPCLPRRERQPESSSTAFPGATRSQTEGRNTGTRTAHWDSIRAFQGRVLKGFFFFSVGYNLKFKNSKLHKTASIHWTLTNTLCHSHNPYTSFNFTAPKNNLVLK